MALKRAGAPPTPTTPDGTAPEVPDEIPRHKGTRQPWIRRPGLDWAPGDDSDEARDRRGRGDYLTRASSFASCIEDKYKIGRARERRIVFGLSRHPELVMRGQAVRGQDEKADRLELEAIADKASEYGRGDEASTKGTAFHALRERADAGEDLSYLDALTREGLAAWTRLLERFRIVASETFVVNDELGAAGTFDALLEVRERIVVHRRGEVLGVLEPGDRVIGDLKSGKWGPKWFGPVYAVQGLIYATGVPYTHRGGRVGWPDGIAPRTDLAVIPHVAVDDPGSASLNWIMLDAARLRARLVAEIHAGRRTEDLFVADEPYREPVPAVLSLDGVRALIWQATTDAELTRIWRSHQGVWDESLSEVARAKLAHIRAEDGTGAPF